MRDIRFTGFSSERAAIFIRVRHVAEPALVARQQRVDSFGLEQDEAALWLNGCGLGFSRGSGGEY